MSRQCTNKRLFFTFFIIAFVSFLFKLYFRTINGDEEILAEQVLSLKNLGFVKAELFDGMQKGWEIRQYHFHKFFILLGFFVTKIFGFDLWTLRLVPFVFFVGLVFMMIQYLNVKSISSNLLIAITLSVFFVNFTVSEYAFLFRPEIVIASLGFCSFLLLYQFIQNGKTWFCISSGAVAGLSVFTHLNGMSYVIAGGLLLLILSRWKSAFLFGISAGVVTILYFFDLNSIHELTAFWEQFRSDPNLSDDDFKLFQAILKIFNEHMRFFWNPQTAVFSILYLFCLIGNFSFLKKKHSALLWYHLILIGSLAAIAHGQTIKYGLVYYPFIVLIISTSLQNSFIQSFTKGRLRSIYIVLFVIYFFTNFGYTVRAMTGDSTTYLIKNNTIYSTHMPKRGANVLTTEGFYFYGYQNYTIHLILAYDLLHNIYLRTPQTIEGFYDFARKRNNDYILLRKKSLDLGMLKMLDFDALKEDVVNFGYKVVFSDDQVVIMKNILEK